METNTKHTAGPWSVRPAWTQGRGGNPRRCGWHLMNGDEWAQTFPRKKDAQAEADRLNKTAAERFFMDHGLWHDRETGQHLYTEDQHVAALESLTDEAWSALEAAGVPRDGVRTLGESIHKLAAIANAVGYGSEEAFGRAFERYLGVSPGQWRNRVNKV